MGKVRIQIRNKINNRVFTATFYIVKKITRNTPVFRMSQTKHPEFLGLTLADPDYGQPAEIQALFGLPILVRITLSHVIKSKDETAMAQASTLGYIIYQTTERDMNGALVNVVSAKPTIKITNEQ